MSLDPGRREAPGYVTIARSSWTREFRHELQLELTPILQGDLAA